MPREKMDRLVDGFREICEAVLELCRKIVDEVRKTVNCLLDSFLRSVATPREYSLMMHSKKRRTRKKWRSILLRRFMKSIRSDGLT